MKVWKICTMLTCLSMFIAGYQHADAQENLVQEAYAIFEQNCLNCHGESGAYKDELLIERTALVDTGVVIPGDPEGSEFYKRLLGPTENGAQMPLNLPPLSQEAVETIASWITIGAPDWDVQYDINFITPAAMLDTIQTHLESLDPFDRPSARYFTMTHLHNAGESPETLNDYRIALSKLVNSLSWRFEITNPTPIDTAQTIFYIDLRHYEWNTRTDVWTHIEQAYPYNIAFDPEIQAGLLDKLTQLQTETGSTVPFVYMDWFLATASLPPLYHDILGLPQTDSVLETQLEVDVASNITNAPGINVWRAGFNDSGVSLNNRVVERHASRYGAYWKSYDFAGSVGSQNIFTHPLDFTHDGGEIIFNLPNGLQAYFLVDANGNRLDAAPIDIVSNPAASDPTVRNGLSCIGCHTQGMKKFEDSVRAAIEQDENPPYNREQALRLYPEQSILDEHLQKDTLRFQQALEKIGGPFADDASRQQFFKRHENEPVQRFHEAFQAPLNASHAAAAVGLETAEFLTQISGKQSLKNLGLQTLTVANGTVKRDAWTSNFQDVISALNTPDSTLPPVEQRPERIPGASVHIPDENLRAAIAEALGKAPDALITAEEMATLTRLVATAKQIQNLGGIQFATGLEHLDLHGNNITDVSPLAGLMQLTNLNLHRNNITDVLPLAGLTQLKHLNLGGHNNWNPGGNTISDISPLAGLTQLTNLSLDGNNISDLSPLVGLTQLTDLSLDLNNISDISPLVGLTKLERLLIRGDTNNPGPNTNYISDISPLTELTQLKWLWLSGNNISDLSPLAGLTQLTDLSLDLNNITDVSPLAGLTELTFLGLTRNNISDFSPLVGLTKLETLWFDIAYDNLSTLPESIAQLQQSLYFKDQNISDLSPLARFTELRFLYLDGNNISDVSPLAGLTKLFALGLENNNISDLSPLAGLTELGSLNLHGNNISDFSPLTGLTKLRMLDLTRNNISDMSPLATIFENTSNVLLYDNPGFPKGGPPIEGPYLWVGVPGHGDDWRRGADLMAEASGNAVTELEIATNGASEGSPIGENVWTAHKVEKHRKVGASLDAIGIKNNIVYGCIFVNSPRYQETLLFIPDGYRIKVWLNGVLVHQSWRSRSGPPDYDYFSPVTLKTGKNVLLFGVSNGGDSFGIFGFAPDTEYTASIRGMEYTLSDPAIYIGDTFALNLTARNVIDLAGWQFDISFDPAALEAVEVNEGDFLKTDGGSTFFQEGTIDNTTGKITGLNATRFSEDGATGTGTLLSVVFLAKAEGETQLTLNDFQLGSTTGEPIAAGPHEVVITIEGQLVTGDVNRDGQVNVLDMILVSRHFGEDASVNPQTDVNRDGIINIQDLIVVAQHLGESTAAAAPSIIAAINNRELTPTMVQAWITQAQVADDGSFSFQQGIATLERLLTLFIPKETALLHNYPNPFNPETWIPYQLAKPAEVTLTIYAANGAIVRTLVLGHQPAGIYQYRSRAAYWDGKNELGESVASGIYFYTLTAGDFNATRKMLIRK